LSFVISQGGLLHVLRFLIDNIMIHNITIQ